MEEDVKVNGENVSKEDFDKLKEQKDIRLVKESDNSYRVLTRLNG